MQDLKQTLYLIVDELRGMATIGKEFAGNPYEAERADRMREMAIRIAALAEDRPQEDITAEFEGDGWLRISPAIGVEAAVFNPLGEILLIQRRDNERWAIPGGLAEIGHTLPESALIELWEEAGLRGKVERLLGVYDGRMWGSRAKVHLVHCIFLVMCDNLSPSPGVEALDARFFARDKLPVNLHPGHELRIPACFAALAGHAYFDPADSCHAELSMHQRP